ncbi:hypothetical protein I317_03443 [Kwoniella heveanensis CBS 569]|nr:hypothetical protein I317_03443 [Kwoniella heveanensis CBS 569]
MSITPPSHKAGTTAATAMDDAPFTEIADKSKKARLSEMPMLPSVVQKFKSPFETGPPETKGPTQVVVTTSHTVVEE